MSTAIEINGVVKYFKSLSRKVLALDQINLQVASGDIFGFLGPNGAGKTTLIKIMMGMLHPDQGTVRIMGQSPFDRASKRKLGYLPERPYFHDFLTGEEFLRFHGRLFCLSKNFIEQRIPQVLQAVDLERGRKLELKRYSKGMLQRIGLAQALLHDPDVLVLDEPMSGLDPLGRREVRDLIASIAKTGKTVFFSTHIVSDIEAICTNVGFINKGRLKSIQNLDEALGKTLKSIEVRYSLPESVVTRTKELTGSSQLVDGWVKNILVSAGITADTVESEATQVIEAVIKAKGRVKSVIPRKGNLEELFFEDMS